MRGSVTSQQRLLTCNWVSVRCEVFCTSQAEKVKDARGKLQGAVDRDEAEYRLGSLIITFTKCLDLMLGIRIRGYRGDYTHCFEAGA